MFFLRLPYFAIYILFLYEFFFILFFIISNRNNLKSQSVYFLFIVIFSDNDWFSATMLVFHSSYDDYTKACQASVPFVFDAYTIKRYPDNKMCIDKSSQKVIPRERVMSLLSDTDNILKQKFFCLNMKTDFLHQFKAKSAEYNVGVAFQLKFFELGTKPRVLSSGLDSRASFFKLFFSTSCIVDDLLITSKKNLICNYFDDVMRKAFRPRTFVEKVQDFFYKVFSSKSNQSHAFQNKRLIYKNGCYSNDKFVLIKNGFDRDFILKDVKFVKKK